MRKQDLLSRITINPDVLVGKPTIRGLRISVSQILMALSNNVPVSDLLKDYPELEPDDILVSLAFHILPLPSQPHTLPRSEASNSSK